MHRQANRAAQPLRQLCAVGSIGRLTTSLSTHCWHDFVFVWKLFNDSSKRAIMHILPTLPIWLSPPCVVFAVAVYIQYNLAALVATVLRHNITSANSLPIPYFIVGIISSVNCVFIPSSWYWVYTGSSVQIFLKESAMVQFFNYVYFIVCLIETDPDWQKQNNLFNVI